MAIPGCLFSEMHMNSFRMGDSISRDGRERSLFRDVQQQEVAVPCNDLSTQRRCWDMCRVFLICLLACVITTAIGVLILSLVYVGHFQNSSNSGASSTPSTGGSLPQTTVNVNITFLFLYHLGASKEYVFQGGAIHCGSYRRNASAYSSAEEMAFGATLNYFQSQISVCTLDIKSGGLRVPNWNLNANVHGLVITGTLWIGVIEVGSAKAVTYNATTGAVIFFPQNRLYWIKNVGSTDSSIVLFFSAPEEPFSLDVNDVFFSTPQDILARTLSGFGGIDCIRSVVRPTGDSVISLPSNLAELIQNATYPQSAARLVLKYYFSLNGGRRHIYSGGVAQWARCYSNTTTMSTNATIFSNSLISHPNTLSLQVLRLHTTAIVTPHSHVNANAMAYVFRGCGKAGVVGPAVAEDYDIGIGDVIFFPEGMSYYIRSTCDEDLVLVISYSTCGKLETLYMDDYMHAITGNVLAQLVGTNTPCLVQIPVINNNVTVVDPGAQGMTTTTTPPLASTSRIATSTTTTTTTPSTSEKATTRAVNTPFENAVILDPDAVNQENLEHVTILYPTSVNDQSADILS